MKWMMASQMSTNSFGHLQFASIYTSLKPSIWWNHDLSSTRKMQKTMYVLESPTSNERRVLLLCQSALSYMNISIDQTLRRKINSSLGAHRSHWETGTRWKSVPDKKQKRLVGWSMEGSDSTGDHGEFAKGQEAYACHKTWFNQPESHNKMPSLSRCKLNTWYS